MPPTVDPFVTGPRFPTSAEALRYLKQHYKLIILSNVDNASFAFSRARLGVAFDAIYTAEDIGSYKPSARNFEYLLDHLPELGLDRAGVLHTAESLFHDHGPAKAHHLSTCWIYRRHAQVGFGATMDPAPARASIFGSTRWRTSSMRIGGRSAPLRSSRPDTWGARFYATQFNFVVATNTRAIAIGQAVGFAAVGRLRGTFAHPTAGYVDALVMFRALAPKSGNARSGESLEGHLPGLVSAARR